MSVQLSVTRPLTSSDTSKRIFNRQLHHAETKHYTDGAGDCFRTCVANVLGLHPEEVPHVYSLVGNDPREVLEVDAVGLLNYWLKTAHGLELEQYVLVGPNLDTERFMDWQTDHLTDMLAITLVSAPGGYGHAILTQNGSVVHDPAYPHLELDISFFGPTEVFYTDGKLRPAYISYIIKETEHKDDRTWSFPAYISRVNPREIQTPE